MQNVLPMFMSYSHYLIKFYYKKKNMKRAIISAMYYMILFSWPLLSMEKKNSDTITISVVKKFEVPRDIAEKYCLGMKEYSKISQESASDMKNFLLALKENSHLNGKALLDNLDKSLRITNEQDFIRDAHNLSMPIAFEWAARSIVILGTKNNWYLLHFKDYIEKFHTTNQFHLKSCIAKYYRLLNNFRINKEDLSIRHAFFANAIDQVSIQEYMEYSCPLQIAERMGEINDLCLSDLELTSLEGLDTVTNKSEIHNLNLLNNKIKEFPANVFVGFTALQKLDLSHNACQTLPESFADLKSLMFLNLSNNKIEIIRPNGFTTLTNLQTLDLSHNQIKKLSASSFCGLNELKELYLNNNHIHKLPASLVNNLKKLTRITLENNQIEKTPVSFGNKYCA